MIVQWIRQFLCRHRDVTLIGNVYGDTVGGSSRRSQWRCRRCQTLVERDISASRADWLERDTSKE